MTPPSTAAWSPPRKRRAGVGIWGFEGAGVGALGLLGFTGPRRPGSAPAPRRPRRPPLSHVSRGVAGAGGALGRVMPLSRADPPPRSPNRIGPRAAHARAPPPSRLGRGTHGRVEGVSRCRVHGSARCRGPPGGAGASAALGVVLVACALGVVRFGWGEPSVGASPQAVAARAGPRCLSDRAPALGGPREPDDLQAAPRRPGPALHSAARWHAPRRAPSPGSAAPGAN
jgi:hypothetical protein